MRMLIVSVAYMYMVADFEEGDGADTVDVGGDEVGSPLKC